MVSQIKTFFFKTLHVFHWHVLMSGKPQSNVYFGIEYDCPSDPGQLPILTSIINHTNHQRALARRSLNPKSLRADGFRSPVCYVQPKVSCQMVIFRLLTVLLSGWRPPPGMKPLVAHNELDSCNQQKELLTRLLPCLLQTLQRRALPPVLFLSVCEEMTHKDQYSQVSI